MCSGLLSIVVVHLLPVWRMVKLPIPNKDNCTVFVGRKAQKEGKPLEY